MIIASNIASGPSSMSNIPLLGAIDLLDMWFAHFLSHPSFVLRRGSSLLATSLSANNAQYSKSSPILSPIIWRRVCSNWACVMLSSFSSSSISHIALSFLTSNSFAPKSTSAAGISGSVSPFTSYPFVRTLPFIPTLLRCFLKDFISLKSASLKIVLSKVASLRK